MLSIYRQCNGGRRKVIRHFYSEVTFLLHNLEKKFAEVECNEQPIATLSICLQSLFLCIKKLYPFRKIFAVTGIEFEFSLEYNLSIISSLFQPEEHL